MKLKHKFPFPKALVEEISEWPPLSGFSFLEKLFHFQCNMLPGMLAYVEVGKALLLGTL